MSDSDLAGAQLVARAEEVAGSLGQARYTVRPAAWSPLLPADCAALLAPPVVVRAAALPADPFPASPFPAGPFPAVPRPAAGRHRSA